MATTAPATYITTSEFDGYTLHSHRRQSTGKPFKYEAVTAGGRSTGLTAKASDVHAVAQELVLEDRKQAEIQAEADADARAEARAERDAELVHESVQEELQLDQTQAEVDAADARDLLGEVPAERAEHGAPIVLDFTTAVSKGYWQALGKRGTTIILGMYHVQAKFNSKAMQVTITGDDAEQAAEAVETAWQLAADAFGAWQREDDVYAPLDKRGYELGKIAWGHRVQYFLDFCQGYVDGLHDTVPVDGAFSGAHGLGITAATQPENLI